ncbi:hypothetical protein JKP88DRAFT_241227 [Tribonema minus]|uniref:Uncharacterized protein n=1 Tax=Tribonema minus TaxID=303371 RepID=A0A835Z0T1_9STRA|nr:hypothetical protein JKP88DRAFT_241227 [Tribonema minus]
MDVVKVHARAAVNDVITDEITKCIGGVEASMLLEAKSAAVSAAEAAASRQCELRLSAFEAQLMEQWELRISALEGQVKEAPRGRGKRAKATVIVKSDAKSEEEE